MSNMKHYLITKSIVYAVAAENLQAALEKLDAQKPEERMVFDETVQAVEPNYSDPGYHVNDYREEMRRYYAEQGNLSV